VSGVRVHQRFALDDHEVVAGVLRDLVGSGLAYASGRGKDAMYRIADQSDFARDDGTNRELAKDYLVWQAVYRRGPIGAAEVAQVSGFGEGECAVCLARLVQQGKVRRTADAARESYVSDRLDVPVGQELGWEAAVFDHFQAVVSAIANKLGSGSRRSEHSDVTGGATYSLDLWRGHPLERRVLGTLSRLRAELDSLRAQVDAENSASGRKPTLRVVFYLGQDVREDD
jgi:hypothetical protein